MNKKFQILMVLNDNAPLNFAELFERLETGQTRNQLSAYLPALRNQDMITVNPTTKRYTISDQGAAYVKRWRHDKPPRDTEPPPPPAAAPGPHITPQMIDELQKLHGQLGRVIRCFRGLL